MQISHGYHNGRILIKEFHVTFGGTLDLKNRWQKHMHLNSSPTPGQAHRKAGLRSLGQLCEPWVRSLPLPPWSALPAVEPAAGGGAGYPERLPQLPGS